MTRGRNWWTRRSMRRGALLALAVMTAGLPAAGRAGAQAAFPALPLDGSRRVLTGTAGARFDVALPAGRWLHLRSDRSLSVYDTGFDGAALAEDTKAVRIPTSGTYSIVAEPGDFGDGWIEAELAAEPDVVRLAVGTASVIERRAGQPRVALAELRGGRRYRLAVEGSGALCLVRGIDGTALPARQVSPTGPVAPRADTSAAAPGRPPATPGDAACALESAPLTLVPFSDGPAQLAVGAGPGTALRVLVEETAADQVVSPEGVQPLEVESAPYQRTVVPFWGRVGERAVIGSPDSALVAPFGEPWVDREAGAVSYLGPAEFQVGASPFVAWGGGAARERRRVQVSRGDDDVFPAALGVPVVATNRPFLRAVVPVNLVAGRRYALQVEGANLRAVGFAVRDPNGRRATTASSWTYDEPGGLPTDSPTTAATVIDARHGGRWAVEIDPRGALRADVRVSVTETVGRTPYEPSIDVKDAIGPGDEVDVDLLPGEWARVPVRVGVDAQTVEPIVSRYRNRSFDLTAADVTLWDPDGRLVWSNNKDLEEEVFTGRLGKESKGTERFALLRPNTTYLAVVDPNGELAGRFRLALRSTAQTEIVPVAWQGGRATLKATQVGIWENRTTVRVRLSAPACLDASTLEWGRRCFGAGEAFTAPPGVHAIRAVAAGTSGSVELTTIGETEPARLPLPSVTLRPGERSRLARGSSLVRVPVERPGELHALTLDGNALAPLTAVRDPRGVVGPLLSDERGWFPLLAGTYELVVSTGDLGGELRAVGPVPRLVSATVAANRSYAADLVAGQVLVVSVTGVASRRYVVLESLTPSITITNDEGAGAPARARRFWVRGSGEATILFRVTRQRTQYAPLPRGPAAPR